MNRKKFFQNISFISALIQLQKIFSNPIKISSKKKSVLVIGAGISGLACANKLQQNGFDVLVLESDTKIGGRIKTDYSLGIAFDQGASWIHSPKENPITKLAKEAGIKTFLTVNDNVEIYNKKGNLYTENYIDTLTINYKNAQEEIIKNGDKNNSFEEVFKTLYPKKLEQPFWKFMLSADLEFDIGGDISEISSLYFQDDEVFEGEDVIITNGYGKLADYFAKGLNIKLNSPVSEIDYRSEKIITKTKNEIFESDFVVLTVPLGVLKKKIIQFSPNLPQEKIDIIQNLKMGNVNKFLLLWEKAFWDTSLQYIGITPDTKGKFNYFLNLKKFTEYNALMTFSFGKYAYISETLSNSEIIEEIMGHLKIIYGNKIPNPKNLLRTKWGENKNAFGCYSFPTNGTTSDDFDKLSKSVNNKIFFAGEHTSTKYRATVHGAYLSGLREAEKILNYI